MTINQERDLEIDFSEPYYIARGRILVPGDSDIQGLEDLAGKRVCTALGSTYEETIREEAPDADLRLVDTYSECLELLQNGAIDAISTDDVILTGMIIQDDTLKMVGDELTTEPYGAGIKDGDKEFQKFVSDTLEAARGGRPLGGALPGVGRPVHGHRGAAARDDAPGGARARVAELWEVLTDNFSEFSSGFWVTVRLVAISFVIAMVVGHRWSRRCGSHR